jgi:hypothetical protein
MQARSRQQLLSRLLDLPPDREVTRDVIEAAIWRTIGWDADPSRVSWLMSIIEAYAANRANRVKAALTDGFVPRTIAEEPGSPARVALSYINRVHSVADTPRQPGRVAMVSPALPPRLPPPPRPPAQIPESKPVSVRELDDLIAAAQGESDNLDEILSAIAPPVEGEAVEEDDEKGAGSEGDGIDDVTLKECKECEVPKPLEEFRKNAQNADGLDRRCRKCMSAREKALRDQKKRRTENAGL